MVLPEQIKQRVRVHMGGPVMGVQDSGFSLGYRFTNVMGLMEFRLNNLQPYEYASIVGVPVGGGNLQGTPQVGQTVTVNVNGTPYVYTIQSSDLIATTTPAVYNVTNNVAQLLNANLGASGFVAAPQFAVTYPQPSVSTPQPYWQLSLVSNLGTTFTLTMVATGTLYAVATLQGVQPRPFYTFTDDAFTANGYVGILDYLESKTNAASDLTAKYRKADVVEFRRDELGHRDELYTYWRQRLADYLGIPLYPMQPVAGFGGTDTGTGLII